MLTPIASASPDGQFHIARSHRWLPAQVLADIEAAEAMHRNSLIWIVTDREFNRRDSRPQASAEFIGHRRDAYAASGYLRRDSRSEGYRRRTSRGRL